MVLEDAVVVLVDSVLVIFGTLVVIVEFVEVFGAALDFFFFFDSGCNCSGAVVVAVLKILVVVGKAAVVVGAVAII